MSATRSEPRGVSYSSALADRICGAIAEGRVLGEFLAEEGAGRRQLHQWLDQHPEFACAYELALSRAGDAAAEMAYVASLSISSQNVSAIRAQINHLEWRAAKLNPSRYGDRIETRHTGRIEHVQVGGFAFVLQLHFQRLEHELGRPLSLEHDRHLIEAAIEMAEVDNQL
jgi:hypothetical protein